MSLRVVRSLTLHFPGCPSIDPTRSFLIRAAAWGSRFVFSEAVNRPWQGRVRSARARAQAKVFRRLVLMVDLARDGSCRGFSPIGLRGR